MMPSSVVTKVFVLTFGLAYPSYCSFKAIHTKDSKRYAQWLIYWIVFSIFLSVERFFDQFVIWIPFYYEIKILVILWLVSPATKGSTLFYVKCLHPFLIKREQEIDALIASFNSLSYSAFKQLFRHIFSLLLAMFGQVHYGILEVIKSRYNLQEVKEIPNEKNPSNSIQEASNSTSKQDLSEECIPIINQSHSSLSDSTQVIKRAKTSPVSKSFQDSQATTAPARRRSPLSPPASSQILPRAVRKINPEPGSYFDRYLRPRQRTSASDRQSPQPSHKA